MNVCFEALPASWADCGPPLAGTSAVEAGAALQWAQALLSEPAWWQVSSTGFL